MSTLSQAVVQFIANLHPLYIGEVHEDMHTARCIEDGTLVFPVEEDEDDEDGFVRVCWQGIKPNSSELTTRTMRWIWCCSSMAWQWPRPS